MTDNTERRLAALEERVEELEGRCEGLRSALTGVLISITYSDPSLELGISASLMGNFVEGSTRNEPAGALDVLREIRNDLDEVIKARKANR